MKQIRKSTRFKKDYKKYKHDKEKIKALFYIVSLLEKGEAIPKNYKPHYLKGEYNGFLECHIEDDFLLIWLDEENDVICLERLGTHTQLFK